MASLGVGEPSGCPAAGARPASAPISGPVACLRGGLPAVAGAAGVEAVREPCEASQVCADPTDFEWRKTASRFRSNGGSAGRSWTIGNLRLQRQPISPHPQSWRLWPAPPAGPSPDDGGPRPGDRDIWAADSA
jgi:hypothetical protein